jgi:hypothetical protein
VQPFRLSGAESYASSHRPIRRDQPTARVDHRWWAGRWRPFRVVPRTNATWTISCPTVRSCCTTVTITALGEHACAWSWPESTATRPTRPTAGSSVTPTARRADMLARRRVDLVARHLPGLATPKRCLACARRKAHAQPRDHRLAGRDPRGVRRLRRSQPGLSRARRQRRADRAGDGRAVVDRTKVAGTDPVADRAPRGRIAWAASTPRW